MRRFDGRTAVITGGASGIGEASARRLATEGATVVVADIDFEAATVVAKDIDGIALDLDVASAPSVATGMAAAACEAGPIDVLINNAGGDRMAMFLDIGDTDWAHVVALNLMGTMACTRAVLPSMYERRTGAIVNVSSEAGNVGTVGGAVYAAAKGGVLGFTKAIARESVRLGVRCNAVAPGPIGTPMLATSTAEAGPLGAAIREAMVTATAMGRVGKPEEVAAAIAFLASDDASYMTGQVLAISGGLSM